MGQNVSSVKRYFACVRQARNLYMGRMTWSDVERLAGRLGIPRNTARKWRQRRIPDRWRIALLREAWAAHSLALEVEDLPRGPHDRRRR
jgi:hypothetical protein